MREREVLALFVAREKEKQYRSVFEAILRERPRQAPAGGLALVECRGVYVDYLCAFAPNPPPQTSTGTGAVSKDCGCSPARVVVEEVEVEEVERCTHAFGRKGLQEGVEVALLPEHGGVPPCAPQCRHSFGVCVCV